MADKPEAESGAAVAGAAPCSANLLRLQNETKINFCNAWHEMQQHLGNCDAIIICVPTPLNNWHEMQQHLGNCDGCCEYMYHGIGDLCEIGKDIIARKLAYADTTPDWSPNAPGERPGTEARELKP